MNTQHKPGVSYQPPLNKTREERSRERAMALGKNNFDRTFDSLTRLLLRDFSSFSLGTFLQMSAYLDIPADDKKEYFLFWTELLKAEKKIQLLNNPMNDGDPVYEVI